MNRYKMLASALIGCALVSNVFAKDIQDITTFPKWFQDNMSREVAISGNSKLTLEEYELDVQVKGNFTLVENTEGTVTYHVDIGTGSPVECYIFSEYDGPANSLVSLLDYGLTGVEALNNKKLSAKYTYSLDSGVINKTPYMALDVLYNLGSGNAKVSGVLKGMSALTGDRLQVCMHNEIGYRESFATVFKSFVKGFAQHQQSQSFFDVSYQLSINDIPMGFILESYSEDADGDVQIKNTTSLIIPVDGSNVSRSDSVSNSWSYVNGSLINAHEYTVENGELSSNFQLAYQDDAWQVSGLLQGKEIKATLEYNEYLLSGYGSYVELEALRKSENASAQFKMWNSSGDPTSALTVTLSKIEDDPNANFEIDMSSLVMKFLADEDGIYQKGSINQGPISMHLDLMHSNGKPIL